MVQWWPKAVNRLPRKHACMCFIGRSHRGNTLLPQGHPGLTPSVMEPSRGGTPLTPWRTAKGIGELHTNPVYNTGGISWGVSCSARDLDVFGFISLLIEILFIFISASASGNRSKFRKLNKSKKKNRIFLFLFPAHVRLLSSARYFILRWDILLP